MTQSSQKTHVVVADAVRARFFDMALPEDTLQEVHPYRAHQAPDVGPTLIEDVDLLADKGRTTGANRGDMGRGYESASPTRHVIESRNTDQALDRAAFAQHIADHLEQHHRDHPSDRFILVMPDRMLGDVRQHLPKPLQALVTHELHHEWTLLPVNDIQERLRQAGIR